MNDYRLFRLYQKIRVILFIILVTVPLYFFTIYFDLLFSFLVLRAGPGYYKLWKMLIVFSCNYSAVTILISYTVHLFRIIKRERNFFLS